MVVEDPSEPYLVIEDDCGEIDAYSIIKSYIESERFMQFVNDLAPDLLILKDPFDEKIPVDIGDPGEIPEFKGLALADLTDKKFEEFKKSYGILKLEVEKLNKTISIAAQIGLLFYKDGLGKPVTCKEFKAEYQKYFDGIPQRLVEIIYENLPDKYKSLAGDNAKKPDSKNDATINEKTIENIIEASIATGLICKKDGLEGADDLEAKLARYEFDIPSTPYLKSISKAFKKVNTHFRNETTKII